MKVTTEEFIKKATKVWGEECDYSLSVYGSYRDKVKIRCKRHNIVFEQMGRNHLRGRRGCPACIKENQVLLGKRNGKYKKRRWKKLSKQDRINRFIEVHGVDKYDYSLTNPEGANDKVKIRCKRHNIVFEQAARNHLRGYRGCPVCVKERQVLLGKRNRKHLRKRLTSEEDIILIKKLYNDGVTMKDMALRVGSSFNIVRNTLCGMFNTGELKQKSKRRPAQEVLISNHDEIVKLYNSGATLNSIGDIFNISSWSVSDYLNDKGVRAKLVKRSLWVGEIGGGYWGKIKKGASNRGLEFSISKEDAWELFIKQNRKCALSGQLLSFHRKSKYRTASLDRIDSSKGYEKDNIQWVHKDINMSKWAFSQSRYIELCVQVAKNFENDS